VLRRVSGATFTDAEKRERPSLLGSRELSLDGLADDLRKRDTAPARLTPNAPTGLGLGLKLPMSRGIAVVDVDYGGSTGYGRTYRHDLDGEWGIIDRDDCVAAAMFLGMLTCWAAYRACSVAVRGPAAAPDTKTGSTEP